MNVNRFIDQYGGFSFDEVSFTEVDNIIFSFLSYINLDRIVSSGHINKRTLHDVAEDFFKNYSKKERTVYATRKAIKLLNSIKDKKRYKDLLVYNYVYEFGNDEQFSSFTIEINSKLVYVSFEGTDQLISGWKEDFMFSYMFPTLSQKKAIRYVNRFFTFSQKKIILGGHSKGGNLALVAGMYANFLVKRRIISIYNNDGPGLLEEEFHSKKYSDIEKKLYHIVPNYSIVGLLLLHGDSTIVVRSMKQGILAHDAMSWVVSDKEFERCSLSPFSEKFKNKLDDWLKKYDMVQREKFVISLFSVFDRAGIKSTVDVFEHKKLILKFILETKEIDVQTRKMIGEFIGIVVQVSRDVKIDEIKRLFKKDVK